MGAVLCLPANLCRPFAERYAVVEASEPIAVQPLSELIVRAHYGLDVRI